MLDDGELGRIRGLLRDLDVDLEHRRGEVSAEDLDGPYEVVFASVRRTLAFEGKLDLADLPGKPVWIALHGQDFLPLRVRLRKLGVRFLVQSSVSSEALRLLCLHTLHRGPERRRVPRLPVGCAITYRAADGSALPAQLLDLTREGCRLLADRAVEGDAALAVELPAKLAGGEACMLPGRITRTEPHADGARNLLTVTFDDLSTAALELLDAILAGKVIGTVVTQLGEELTEDVAPLTLTPRSTASPDHGHEVRSAPRRHRRVEYTRKVTALLGAGEHAILARDLSIEGMRSEPLPELPIGTALELALYGSSGAEPILVRAVVARDDGPRGTVFRFEPLPAGERARLAGIIAGAPEIRSLAGGEEDARVVISRGTLATGLRGDRPPAPVPPRRDGKSR